MDIHEQVKLMSNAKCGMKLSKIDGIEFKNIEMLRLTPIELHSIVTWKSITCTLTTFYLWDISQTRRNLLFIVTGTRETTKH